jgi:hypothetical protein
VLVEEPDELSFLEPFGSAGSFRTGLLSAPPTLGGTGSTGGNRARSPLLNGRAMEILLTTRNHRPHGPSVAV